MSNKDFSLVLMNVSSETKDQNIYFILFLLPLENFNFYNHNSVMKFI